MTRRFALALLTGALLPAAPATATTPPPEPVPVGLRTVALERSAQPVRMVRSDVPFSMVGLTWRGPAPDVAQLRVPGGEWVTVDPAGGAGGDTRASEPVWTGPTREVQIRALRRGAPADDVSAVLVDPGRSPADGAPGTRTPGAATVISRAGWGADESLRCSEPDYDDTVHAVALHHTAGTNSYDAAGSFGLVRGIYAYHASILGWCDIGYHALVDRFGQVFEGRAGGLDRAVIGAHAGGFNRRTSSVAMMGLFTGALPTPQLQRSLTELLSWKLDVHRLDPRGEATLVSEGGGTSRYPAGARVRVPVLFGHRDVGNTDCPGDDGYALLPILRSVMIDAPLPPT